MNDIIWNYVHFIGTILAAWGVVWYFGWPWWSGLPLWFAIHTVAVMMSERQRKENEAFWGR